MKRKRILKDVLFIFIFITTFSNGIYLNINSQNKVFSTPQIADTHLLWETELVYEPNQVAISENGNYIICCMDWFNGYRYYRLNIPYSESIV